MLHVARYILYRQNEFSSRSVRETSRGFCITYIRGESQAKRSAACILPDAAAKEKPEGTPPAERLLPAIGWSRRSVRAWMAAPQRFMVPVRTQNGTCAHDGSIRSPRVASDTIAISAMTSISDFNPRSPRGERPVRRHPLQIGNSCFNPRPITASTSFVPYVRKGGEKPGAISQPCLAAKPPFLPGETPTAVLACARQYCQRRPPCGGRCFVCRSGQNSAKAHGNRRFGRLYRSGGVALRASRQGRCKRQNRRASAKGTVSRGGHRFAPLRPAAHGQQFRGAVFLVHIALVQHVQRSRQGGGP